MEINATGLVSGEQIRGQVQFVYNGGEMILPYCFHVVKGQGQETENELETIQDFVEMAKSEPVKVIHLFASEKFLHLPFMKRESWKGLYRGLLEGGSEERAMEEFITSVGEKETVRLSLEEQRSVFVDPEKDTCGEVLIKKNTWGYASLVFESEFPLDCFRKKERVCP